MSRIDAIRQLLAECEATELSVVCTAVREAVTELLYDSDTGECLYVLPAHDTLQLAELHDDADTGLSTAALRLAQIGELLASEDV